MKRRKRKSTLPRMLVLSQSAADVLRWSESAERVVSGAQLATELVKQLGLLLDEFRSIANRLESRSNAARKANRTRSAAKATSDPFPASPAPQAPAEAANTPEANGPVALPPITEGV